MGPLMTSKTGHKPWFVLIVSSYYFKHKFEIIYTSSKIELQPLFSFGYASNILRECVAQIAFLSTPCPYYIIKLNNKHNTYLSNLKSKRK